MSTHETKERDVDLMVTVDTTSEEPVVGAAQIDDLLDAIPDAAGAAVGFSERSTTITLTGTGETQGAAIASAVETVDAALKAAGLPWAIAHVDVAPYDADDVPVAV